MITVLGTDADLHNRWLGFAESKLRHFVFKQLETLHKDSKDFFELEHRPWSKTYKIASTLLNARGERVFEETDSYFIGVRVKRNTKIEHIHKNLTQPVKDYFD